MDTSPFPQAPSRPLPSSAPAASSSREPATGLGAEVRESVVLLAGALGVTVGLTAVVQAALSALA